MREEEDETEDALAVEGVDDAAQAVAKFLTTLRKSTEADGDITLVLSQTGKGLKEVVHEMPLDFRTEIEEQVTELVDHAVEDCLGMRAKSMRYVVTAKDEDDAPLKGRAAFTLKCPDTSDEDDLEDIEDLPNRKGLMGMLMRHQQSVMKMAVGGSKHTHELLMSMVREKDQRIKILENAQVNNLKAFEELISGRHARDIELRRMENAERRKDQVASVLMQSAPILVGKVLGGGAGAAEMAQAPGGRTQLELMLEGFLGSISQEQFGKLMELGIFEPHQTMTLMEIIRFVMDRQEAEKKGMNGHAPGPKAEGQAAEKQGSA